MKEPLTDLFRRCRRQGKGGGRESPRDRGAANAIHSDDLYGAKANRLEPFQLLCVCAVLPFRVAMVTRCKGNTAESIRVGFRVIKTCLFRKG